MEGTLESLEAGIAEAFAGWPRLLRLLMQLFAMLRERMDRVGLPQEVAPVVGDVAADDVPVPSAVGEVLATGDAPARMRGARSRSVGADLPAVGVVMPDVADVVMCVAVVREHVLLGAVDRLGLSGVVDEVFLFLNGVLEDRENRAYFVTIS